MKAIKEDRAIAIEDVRESYKYLKENYSDKQVLNLVEYKGTDHMVTPDMVDRTINWIKSFI